CRASSASGASPTPPREAQPSRTRRLLWALPIAHRAVWARWVVPAAKPCGHNASRLSRGPIGPQSADAAFLPLDEQEQRSGASWGMAARDKREDDMGSEAQPPLLPLDLQDLVAARALRRRHLGRLALGLADQRTRDRARDRDEAVADVGLEIADDLVLHL